MSEKSLNDQSKKLKKCDGFKIETATVSICGSNCTDFGTSSVNSLPIGNGKLEQKWCKMLENWDHLMTSNYNKVQLRCRKGIPHSLRAAAWQAISGAAYLQQKDPGMFNGFLQKESEWMVYIEKDVPRACQLHEMFAEKDGLGRSDLRKVLKAYSIYNPKVGYCHWGMTSIAAMLLLLMPAEQAFWCLVSIMNKYLPGYFSAGLLAVQLDGRIMETLVQDIDPKISTFLKKNDVQAMYYAIEWFSCAYTRVLPWETVLRLWDMFLCEGVKALIKAGVTLILLAFSDKKVRDDCNSLEKVLYYLKYKLPKHLLEENFFMNQLCRLQISEKQFKEAHISQLAKLNDNYS